jgi:hypothetical protein
MYNGQYMKAIVHVLVFVVLVAITGSHGIFGMLIGAWVLYQVFDANQTAKARRDGQPLPDPFGLNELGYRMGMPQPPSTAYQPPAQAGTWQTPPPGFVPGAPVTGMPAGGYAGTQAPPYAPVSGAQGYAPPYAGGPGIPPTPPIPPIPPEAELDAARREPIGAIVLIGLGMLFLFNTLGIFSFEWIHHGWPLLIIGIGIWLFVRRARYMPRPPQPPAGPGPSMPGNDRPSGGAQ